MSDLEPSDATMRQELALKQSARQAVIQDIDTAIERLRTVRKVVESGEVSEPSEPSNTRRHFPWWWR